MGCERKIHSGILESALRIFILGILSLLLLLFSAVFSISVVDICTLKSLIKMKN